MQIPALRPYQTDLANGVPRSRRTGHRAPCIVLMELISILENYGEISPDAVWVRRIIKKLRNFKDKEDNEK
ncbi:MAG: hypothetical protein IJ060_07450 [Oscillospiraceae bacterium]|nr:hypothetical protein [Oscillospiraceae bacterium]